MNGLIEFIFPRRLHRLAFLLRVIAVDVISSFSIFPNPGTLETLFAGFCLVLLVYDVLFVLLPRIRDLEISGWWLLAFLIPYANSLLSIILLLRAPRYRLAAASHASN
jgi:uncharacterized membrane protein YhaH (DUF805 family)